MFFGMIVFAPIYTFGPMYLNSAYFKANVYILIYCMNTWALRLCTRQQSEERVVASCGLALGVR